MGKDSTEIKSVSDIENKVKFFIKKGYPSEQIKKRVISSVPDNSFSIDEVSEVVDSVCSKHPNYRLIQKIMRSKLAINKDLAESPIYILDTKLMDIDTIHPRRLNDLFYKMNFSDRIFVCKMDYRPDKAKVLLEDSLDNWVFNSYKPPFWYRDFYYSEGEKSLPVVDAIPDIYHEFLNHLVDGDELSYNYILDWLSNAIKSRNYCMLCTIGAKGIGKGVLGSIMKQVFGPENYAYTGNRVVSSSFNSQIMNKKLVYCDEISITNTKEEDKLKLLINDDIEIEQKGVDAKEIKNFANIYISSNNLDAIKLSGDNRRFSIVNLTSVKLSDIFSKEKIESLMEEENIRNLSLYLYNRDVDPSKMLKVFTSARTEEIRLASLNSWQEWLLFKYIPKNKGTILSISELQDKMKEDFGLSYSPPGRTKMKELQERFPECFKIFAKKTDGVVDWYLKAYKEGEYEG